jgi:serine/threonine protein kinase
MADVPSSAFSPEFSLPFEEHSPESLQNLVYLAPEQLLRKKVDGHGDIYALGAVLYRMLTGAPPLNLHDVHDVQEAQHIILSQQPDAPGRHNEEVPFWLDSVVLRALQKYPRFRFESIEEMHAALEAQQPVALPQAAGESEAEHEALHRGSLAHVENQKRWKHRRDVLFDVFKGAAFGACGGFVLGILIYGVRVALVGWSQVLREGALAALMLTIVVAAAVGAVIGWLAQSND